MNISEAQRKAYEKLERKCDRLQHQRDQLREALKRMVEDAEDINAVYSDLLEATDEARAALKATEEG